MTGCVLAFEPKGMAAPSDLIGCFQGDVSEPAGGATGWTPCHVGGACAVIGAAAGAVDSDFDHGQMFDHAPGCALAAARCGDIAMDAGSARAVVAAKPKAVTAAGIILRQAVSMAVLLDFVDRRHPCRRLMVLLT
jgi:hypothetical protein